MRKNNESSLPALLYALGLCAALPLLFSVLGRYIIFAQDYRSLNAAREPSGAEKPQKPYAPDVNSVKFSFYGPDTNEVELHSDFNLWGLYKIKLIKDSSGFHNATVLLPKGEYEYYFICDGVAAHDKMNKNSVKRQGKTISVKSVP
jgi:hypothetical protein